MGTEIRCRKCREVLFNFDGVPTDVIWYSRLRAKLNGECPKCGHKLLNPSKYAKKMQLEIKSITPVIAE